jgi:hypothetical protein
MIQPYQFKRHKQAALARPMDKTGKNKAPTQADPMGLIQGQQPMSHQEWYVAQALWKLKLDFEYQYGINGGQGVRGGQAIDFMVYTVPLPTPIYVQGSYWHRAAKSSTDLLKVEQAKISLRGQANDPVLIPEEELQDPDMAVATIRRRILNT